MANFSSLKQAIQNYIKENGNKEITGNLLQEILLSMVVTMGDNAINSLTTVVNELNTILHNVDAEPTKNSDNLVRSGGVWSGINREALRAFNAETFEARFNSSNNRVEFFNQSGDMLYWFDASAFVVSGLVVDVYIDGDNLVFVIDTQDGEKTIEVPLTDIFNPNNYYTKTQIDGIVRAIRELYDGAEYRGFITPSSQAESKEGVRMVCFATEAGTYTNFLANYDTPIEIPVRGIWVFERGVDADDWTAYSLLEIDKVYAPAQASGMGRVVLQKNMVNGVNTLTQDMFYKGEVGSRVPNTNTIFVIEYDFILGEDITVPANCVLEFDGGKISNRTIIGNNTLLKGEVKAYVALEGTFANEEMCMNWFLSDTTESIHTVCNNIINVLSDAVTGENLYRNCILSINGGTYNLSDTIYLRPFCKLRANGAVLIKSTTTETAIVLRPNADDVEKMNYFDLESNNSYNAKPYYNGDIIQGNNTLTLMAVNPYIGVGLWLGSYGDVAPSRLMVTNIRISGISIIGFGTGIHMAAYHIYNIVLDHIEVQRCNHAIRTDEARWESGFHSVYNWDEHISITNSLFGDKADGNSHGDFVFMKVSSAFHIDNTCIDGFDCIFNTTEEYKAVIRAHITNCHFEANGKDGSTSVENAAGIVAGSVSDSSVIHITNSRFVLHLQRQSIMVPPNCPAEIYFDNVTFNCSKTNIIYDSNWTFVSFQDKKMNIKQTSRPLIVMSNGYKYRGTPCIGYYNNIVPNGLCDDIAGAYANLATLKEGYKFGGFKFSINEEATAGGLNTNNNSIFSYVNGNKCFVLEVTEGVAATYTIESPLFKVNPLNDYGFNVGFYYNTMGAATPEDRKMQLASKVVVYDDEDNVVDEITSYDGETAMNLLWIRPNNIYWPSFTTHFVTKNNAYKAKLVFTLSVPSVIYSGQLRFFGVYVENQD